MKFTPLGLAAVGHDLVAPFVVDFCLDPIDDLAEDRLTTVTFTSVARVLPGRRVSGLAQYEGKTVFAKLFYGKRARRYWQRELQGAARMQQAGVLTPAVLEKGSTADGSGFVVFYEALPEPHDLRDNEFEDMLAAVQLLAKLHDANCVQTDVHVYNFLRSRGHYYAIDADGIRRAHLLRQQFANLAMFMAQRPPIMDAELDDIWAAYSASRGAYVARMGSAEQLKKLTRTQRRLRVRRYLRKTQRDCSAFVQHHSFNHNFLCDRQYWHLLQRFMLSPETFVGEGTPIKLGNSATVVRITLDDVRFIVKRYNVKSFTHRVRRWFKRRPREAWCNGHLLAFLGIRTAQPIALLENKWGWFRGVCYLVMPDVGERNLGQVLCSDPEKFAALAPSTVALLKGLQAAQLEHGDLKATNFILSQEDVVLIDYDAVRPGSNQHDLKRFMANWDAYPGLHAAWQAVLTEELS